jgi:hypothetical protein
MNYVTAVAFCLVALIKTKNPKGGWEGFHLHFNVEEVSGKGNVTRYHSTTRGTFFFAARR